ncbi:phage tail assembly protein [Pararhodobacter sp. CCB-MM2]|uniref:phage tail assembly protein n=1 Tax=Pararhodobacter sp. CCB-MM2 TaxID=1786003 RepID=UPI000835C7F9|nr:phage tail assembly protein [Pararhodobacter sp. CCB-MM2]
MDYPIEVTLKRPVVIGDQTYATLSFDEPDLATSLAVDEAKTGARQTVVLLAGMAGVPEAVILKIKESDYREIGKRVLDPYQKDVRARMGESSGNEDA